MEKKKGKMPNQSAKPPDGEASRAASRGGAKPLEGSASRAKPLDGEASELAHTMARGLFFKFGSLGVVKGLSLVYNLLILRYLSPVEAGLFFLANNAVSLLSQVMGLGLPMAVMRYAPLHAAKGENEKLKNLIWTLTIVSTLIAMLMAVVIIVFGNYIASFYDKPIGPVLPWVAVLSALFLLFNFWSNVLDSLKQFEHSAMVQALQQLFRVGLTAAVLFLIGHALEWVFRAYFISLGLLIIYLGGYFWSWQSKLPGGLRIDLKAAWESIRFGLQVYLSGVADVIAANMDILLLGYFQPLEVVAAYSAIVIFVRNIAPFVIAPVGLVQQPLLVEQHTKQTDIFARMVREVSRLTLYLGVPLLAIFLIYSGPILHMVTPAYESSAGLVWYFIPMVLAALMSNSSRNALFASGHAKSLMAVSILILVLNFVLNITLIPIYGMVGSAMGTSLAVVAGEGLAIYLARKKLGAALHPDIWRALAAGAAMVGLGYAGLPGMGSLMSWAGTGVVQLGVAIGISGIVYFLAMLIGGGLNAQDWELGKQLLGRYWKRK